MREIKCRNPDCDRTAARGNLCQRCYQRIRRNGDFDQHRRPREEEWLRKVRALFYLEQQCRQREAALIYKPLRDLEQRVAEINERQVREEIEHARGASKTRKAA